MAEPRDVLFVTTLSISPERMGASASSLSSDLANAWAGYKLVQTSSAAQPFNAIHAVPSIVRNPTSPASRSEDQGTVADQFETLI